MVISLFAWIQWGFFSIYNNWQLVLLTKTLSGISCLRAMYKWWMSPESFKELGLTLEAPWKICLVPCLFTWFMAYLMSFQVRNESCFPVMWQSKNLKAFWGNLGNLRNSPKSMVSHAKPWWAACGLTSSPSSGLIKVQPWDSLWRSSKTDLRKPVWSIAILIVFMQIIKPNLLKLDLGSKWPSLRKMRVILGREIVFP